MGLTPLPPDHLATLVTSLEMRARPKPAPLPEAPLVLVRWKQPSPAKYRALFTRVGSPWLWFSRLAMSDADLMDIIHHDDVMIWAVCDRAGIEVGILELDFRVAGECEISFFGLVPELMGKGYGRWLMAQAMAAAWRPGVSRVWLHSCTLDAPSALNFYIKSGFVPFARAIESFADPRLTGLLPESAGPHVPLLRVDSSR